MSKVVVVLVGFSGAGKSSIARELAMHPNWIATDLDLEIERKAGRSVSQIIRVEGENRFRELETEALADALENAKLQTSSVVIATGGGTLIAERNRELIEQSKALLIQLGVSLDAAVQRLSADEVGRPMLMDEGQAIEEDSSERQRLALSKNVAALMAKRSQLYEAAPVEVVTEFASIKQIAVQTSVECEINSSAKNQSGQQRSRLVVIPYELADNGHSQWLLGSVVIGHDLLDDAQARISRTYPRANRLVVLVDSEVRRAWNESLQQTFGKDALLLEVATGEQSKRLELVDRYAEDMLRFGVTRSDVLVAIGGGVVGDLGGLIASIYMRGMGLVHIPTTVVAQVDSAIGGKTAVNLQGGKNAIGTIYPAQLVISDIGLLSTLPEREYRSGIAEVVKYGLIGSEAFFKWLEENAEAVLQRRSEVLLELIRFSARMKLDVVRCDLNDTKGKRVVLNFGHTVGHSVEQITEYKKFLHGEAVSIGMVVALKLGEQLGVTEIGLSKRAGALLAKFGLPVEVPSDLRSNEDVSRWLKALKADKKREAASVNFVLVEGCGRATTKEIGLQEIVNALQ